MEFLWDGLKQAVDLIVHGDHDILVVVATTLRVALWSTLIALAIGLPLGLVLGLGRFHGRAIFVVLLNAMMGLPPVVVGLALYLLLSRSGPLGELGILFTPPAMVIAQTVLVTPIIAALARQTIEDLWVE